MLAAFETFDRAEQDGTVAGPRRVGANASVGAGERKVVGDVGDVESRRRVPSTVPLRRESFTSVVRRIRVAVKIDGDEIGVGRCRHHRGHGARHQHADRIPDHEGYQRPARQRHLASPPGVHWPAEPVAPLPHRVPARAHEPQAEVLPYGQQR